jgi:hypothetical protein
MFRAAIRFVLFIALFVVANQAVAIIDVSLQMQLGNPSGATVNTNNHNHYLVQREVAGTWRMILAADLPL